VTHLYTRPSVGAPIHWDPDKTDHGRQAIESVVGPVDAYPVEVTDEQTAQIREEYQRLLEQQTDGGSS